MSNNTEICLGDVIRIQGQYIGNLGDENRNLNEVLYIVYNPQITNIKLNQVTSINSTLGSKYPFYRKNGVVHYRTFSLSGLLTFDSQFEMIF